MCRRASNNLQSHLRSLAVGNIQQFMQFHLKLCKTKLSCTKQNNRWHRERVVLLKWIIVAWTHSMDSDSSVSVTAAVIVWTVFHSHASCSTVLRMLVSNTANTAQHVILFCINCCIAESKENSVGWIIGWCLTVLSTQFMSYNAFSFQPPATI